MSDSYKLRNRYGLHIYLKPFKENVYILEGPDTNYMRAGFDTETTMDLLFVDPEGGPFLSLSDKLTKIEIIDLETKEVIKFNEQQGKKTAYILTFKDNIVPKELIVQTF